MMKNSMSLNQMRMYMNYKSQQDAINKDPKVINDQVKLIEDQHKVIGQQEDQIYDLKSKIEIYEIQQNKLQELIGVMNNFNSVDPSLNAQLEALTGKTHKQKPRQFLKMKKQKSPKKKKKKGKYRGSGGYSKGGKTPTQQQIDEKRVNLVG